MTNVNININLDKKCIECGKKGVCDNGLCLKCVSRAIAGKPMKTSTGQKLAKKFGKSGV